MSMQITSDANTQKILNTYNSNQAHAEKSFDRISSGLKIVNAGNNSSAWSISERMRNLIRALTQNHQNIQNGSAIVRTAERGVDQIIQNLRYMKELAIDSANDSNGDADRLVLQKEYEQRMKMINDIAQGTEYNGKILLDGTYLSPVPDYGNTKIANVLAGLSDSTDYNSKGGSITRNGSSKAEWKFDVDKTFGNNGNNWINGNTTWKDEWIAEKGSSPNVFSGSSSTTESGTDFGILLNFNGMTATEDYPATLDKQGLSILCSGCEQFINIVFDASKPASSSTEGIPPNSATNSRAIEFVIGVQDVQSEADLPKAIFEGIAAAKHVSANVDSIYISHHNLRIAKSPYNNTDIMLLKQGTLEMQFLNHAVNKTIAGNPLWVQHGADAGQRFHVYIDGLSTNYLGLDETDVKTRDNALSALDSIGLAIDYALEQATNLGAYLQRMEATDLNVTTLNENLQASESTIRDADMAKEMVDYTRYRMLTRSSQAMLAQANQNQKSVAGLTK